MANDEDLGDHITIRLALNPEEESFTLGYEYDMDEDMSPEVSKMYLRIMYGIMFMLAYRPHDFIEYAERFEASLNVSNQDALQRQAPTAEVDEEVELEARVTHFPEQGRDN